MYNNKNEYNREIKIKNTTKTCKMKIKSTNSTKIFGKNVNFEAERLKKKQNKMRIGRNTKNIL